MEKEWTEYLCRYSAHKCEISKYGALPSMWGVHYIHHIEPSSLLFWDRVVGTTAWVDTRPNVFQLYQDTKTFPSHPRDEMSQHLLGQPQQPQDLLPMKHDRNASPHNLGVIISIRACGIDAHHLLCWLRNGKGEERGDKYVPRGWITEVTTVTIWFKSTGSVFMSSPPWTIEMF